MNRPFASLYVHVPFCRGRKCDYCAFYSLPGAGREMRRRYLERLAREFAESATAAEFLPLRSVFLGGGTPSLLAPAEIRRLTGLVRKWFKLAPDCEFSTEANPESLTPARIEAFLAGGVNRFSLGVQSFSPTLRRRIGRRGGVERLPELVAELRRRGVRNLGFDLMYALPGQTLAQWREELRRACGLGPEHLSAYALTVEDETPLARRATPATADALAVAMWQAAATELAAGGLRRYEISNFARPGRECRHNLEIWHGATYLGCGPAACSFDGELRWSNPADLEAWLRPAIPRTLDPLPADRRAAEILAFGLRTVAGWELARFQAVSGFAALALRGEAIQRLVAQGLLKLTPRRLRPTRRGLLFHNLVAAELL
ncbi:MAG: radical SAM family heme chaperone HemW [Lentisphaeria bacterium]|jgi:oxygen-independent coproporphyrinogen-3 oxidase